MYQTAFGAFHGTSWENLCQLVFKRKYGADGYQHIQVSPGDYGLEGYTSKTGYGFQCYCPEKQYSRKELYEKQRQKITDDINKLINNKDDLLALLGTTKVVNWVFVTPDLASNALLRHARVKEKLVRDACLPHVDPDFRILLHDAEHYLLEIRQVQSAQGQALDLFSSPPRLDELTGPPEEYEANVRRKCIVRLEPKKSSPTYERLVSVLTGNTLRSFMETEKFLHEIERSAPVVHGRLIALVREYENTVLEKAITWTGSAEELTSLVQNGLISRIVNDLKPEFNETNASQVARHIVARWLAVCSLDYE
ncbi:hypothetical protein Herbaro_06015 [Herbaspirillum sp. WKF16]|uniref:hypothetical protein n=1 Tax=Herbaspirillum sp. WKF16 TaxID=3028312 RepID=UPI0023A9546B|nr:hypothetical protein [Herbaspirillum sp. WKF16]WDZ97343.1 hypothetical protein Herbaro_06015 [Herbaspirillum sp. WKF16]